MKLVTEKTLSDIEDFILEKYESKANQPKILFQTIPEEDLEEFPLEKR